MAMPERDDDRFLARWSRRKQAAREAAREPQPAESEARLPDGAPEAEAPHQLTEIAELPDPDTLDASSDFSVFLRRDVPLETHQKALRRLWRLDPIYNRIDGLDDYCEDFTDQAKVVKGLRTAYKVGRGFLEHLEDAVPQETRTPTLPTEPSADEPKRVAASETPVIRQGSGPATPPATAPTKTRARTEPRRPRPLPRRG
jgi:hypothetical protein